MGRADDGAAPPDVPLWHAWLLFSLIWGGTMLVMGTLNLAAYAARDPVASLFAVAWSPLVGALLVPSMAVAAVLRASWLRFAPPPARSALWPAAVTGALAAPLGVMMFTGPSGWFTVGRGGLGVLLPMMLVNGAVAGSLAHRRTSPRDRRWWGWVLASVAVGLASWALLDPGFPLRT